MLSARNDDECDGGESAAGPLAPLPAPELASAPALDAAVASAPRPGSPNPSAALLTRIESLVLGIIGDCAAYKRARMADQAEDGHCVDGGASSSQQSQLSQHDEAWDAAFDDGNDGEDEASGSQGSARRKRKRRPAAKKRLGTPCFTIRYDSAADEFNHRTAQYEPCDDDKQGDEQAVLDDSIEQLSQQGQDGLQRRQRAAVTRTQHSLRFAFPVTGAAHCTNVICTLSLVYSILATRRAQSLRSLYYEQVGLANNQLEINRAVVAVCSVLGVPRKQLMLHGNPRGHICGEVSYRLSTSATTVDCRPGVQIPPIPHLAALHLIDPHPELSYILVVEKHTVFTTLVSACYPAAHHCLLVTGCGFADSATRDFLVQLSALLPRLAVYCLVDCDVWGLSIYQTYKFGGKRRGAAGERLPVAAMQLLGLHVWECREMKAELEAAAGGGRCDAVMELPASDRRRIERMLKEPPAECDDVLRRELSEMLQFGYKCEVEALSAYGGPSYLAEQYLPDKVARLREEATQQAAFAEACWDEAEGEEQNDERL